LTRGVFFEVIAAMADDERELDEMASVLSKVLIRELDADAVAAWLLRRHGRRWAQLVKPIEYARVNNMAQRVG
jgi:hypothetical protein